MQEKELDLAQKVIKHFYGLLLASRVPLMPRELRDDPAFLEVHRELVNLRSILTGFSRGDVFVPIEQSGFVFGSLKTLQANLQHLISEVKQFSGNDFEHHMDYLGELSSAFSGMFAGPTLTQLEMKQESLTQLTASLRREIQARRATLEALRKSEAKFRYLAEHDPLTDVLNRRSFLSMAESEMQKAAFAGVPCALGLLDVDYFKVFNDTHGHIAGDNALRHLVNVARTNLRGLDFLGRFGGEEFILFFFDANEADATAACERIRKAIETTPLPHDGEYLPLTASIGVSVVLPEWSGERNQDYLRGVVYNADTALYMAKKDGRNSVFLGPTVPPELNFQESAENLPERRGRAAG